MCCSISRSCFCFVDETDIWIPENCPKLLNSPCDAETFWSVLFDSLIKNQNLLKIYIIRTDSKMSKLFACPLRAFLDFLTTPRSGGNRRIKQENVRLKISSRISQLTSPQPEWLFTLSHEGDSPLSQSRDGLSTFYIPYIELKPSGSMVGNHTFGPFLYLNSFCPTPVSISVVFESTYIRHELFRIVSELRGNPIGFWRTANGSLRFPTKIMLRCAIHEYD